MSLSNSIELTGKFIKLEIFNPEIHLNALHQLQDDVRIWRYFTHLNNMADWLTNVKTALQRPDQIPFIVRNIKDKRIIGSTRFYKICSKQHTLAIGYTWYLPAFWGTLVNTECKFLLLQQAFERQNLQRIEFYIDPKNEPAHKAIIKLGATQEGLLRDYVVLPNGRFTDRLLFSIIKPEWSEIKFLLNLRLNNYMG